MSKSTKWTDFNNQMTKHVDWRKLAHDVLGLELIGEPISAANGWVKCRSVDGADENPSAGFNVHNGYYKDFRDGMSACSAYDLMVQLEVANTFMEAKKQVAKMFGVPFPVIDAADPEHGVKWQQWSDNLAMTYCRAKPPITPEALKYAGARMCMRFSDPCFALPVMGAGHSVEPVGWMFIPRNGKPFQHEAAKGAKCICKIQEGEVASFVTSPVTWEKLNDQKGCPVYWCEGAPDMLAGMSLYPDAAFVTNAHGCAEQLNERQLQAMHLGEHYVYLIGDADLPGVRGVLSKKQAFGTTLATVNVLIPPYEIVEKHGKDYRDWCAEGARPNPRDGLVEPPPGLEVPNEKAEKLAQAEIEHELEKLVERQHSDADIMLKKLGITILSAAPSGHISMYCKHTKGQLTVDNVGLMKYSQWIQFVGPRFTAYVVETQKDWEARTSNGERGLKTYREFLNMVSTAATARDYHEYVSAGAGIWPVTDEFGDPTGDVLIVKHSESYRYNSNGDLIKLETPIAGNKIANIGTRFNWFDNDLLAVYLKQAHNLTWREETYKDLYDLFSMWNWGNDNMVQVVIGLLMASTMQTFHAWRPIVALTGESNSGKTILMTTIARMFGQLAQLSARSTAAGVLQNLKDDGKIILLDEFDSGTEQTKLLKVFRAAGRGQETLMGTCTHNGKSYSIAHIPWISGIHASSRDQADLNRMIPLRLLTAKKHSAMITLDNSRALANLGLKMIAGVIVTNQASLELTKHLHLHGNDTIPSRYRESYAVPFGHLGAFLGIDADALNDVMTDYLKQHVVPEVQVSDARTDQEAMLMDILQSEIRLGANAPEDNASVAEILFDARFELHRDIARTKGVGYVPCKFQDNYKVCFVGRKLTGRGGILANTSWADIPNVLQILERLPKALSPRKEKQMVAGMVTTVVSVDYAALKEWAKHNDAIASVGVRGEKDPKRGTKGTEG